MRLIVCDPPRHGASIAAILNDAIATTTALYEYSPRTSDDMSRWFRTKEAGQFPVVVAVDDSDAVLGFATYGAFRAYPAYKYTVEHSVYVHRDHRGLGIGRALLRDIIARAACQQYHVMIGVIDAGNASSIALHEREGFDRAGVIRQVGYKFGRWLDAAFYQLILATPTDPVDG